MKQGWEIKKLGEVATILNGYAFDSKLFSEDSNDMPLIRIRDIKRGYTETFYKGDFSDGYIIKKGDYLIGMDGEFNIAEWKGNDALLNQRVCKIVANDIVDRYLFWYMPVVLKQIEDATPFVTVKHLSSKQLLNAIIPIPPREEQERIVEELDCLSGVIEKKREQLKELDALAQSIFYQMFGDPITNEKGWEVKPLKNSVIEMFLGPFGSALKTDCYVSKEDAYCMVYEQKHAIKKTMELETHYIDKDKFESLKRFEVHSGDFVMSCRGTIGEIYRLPNDAPIGIIHPSLMKIRIREDIYHPIFFVRLLTRIVKNENTNGNCVQMAITAKELGAREPIVPPLTLQQEFADKIEAIEKQKELIKESIKETETLFNARMDYYFN